MKVGTVKMLDQEIEVHATASGYWSFHLPAPEDTDPDDPEPRPTFLAGSEDFDRGKKTARRKLRELDIPVAIEFIDQGHRSIARGIHRRTGEILAWRDDGSNDGAGTNTSYRSWGARVLKPDTDPKEIETYYRKQRQLQEANRRLREWYDAHSFDLSRAVKDALAAQMDTLDPSELETDD